MLLSKYINSSFFFTALERLDVSRKREYETAKEIVPHLVQSETPLIKFLRAEDYEPIPAARRLALNWKHRKELFGERWMLPMVQTSRGALTHPEISLLRSGYFCMYSPTTCSEKKVLLIDYSALTEFVEVAKPSNWDLDLVVDRVTFYLATVDASNNYYCQVNTELIHVVTSKKRPAVPFRTRIWEMVRTSFPVKISKVTVAQAFEPNKTELLDFLRFQTSSVIGMVSRLPVLEIYSNSVTGTVQKLEASYNIPKQYIPTSLGGDMSIDTKMAEWIRSRLSIEEVSSISPTTFDVTAACKSVVTVASKKPTGKGIVLAKRKSRENETDEEFYKRRAALYSRRMYHKRKNEMLALQEVVKTWENLNTVARKEMERLECLLTRAQAIVVGIKASVPDGPPNNFPQEWQNSAQLVQSTSLPQPSPPSFQAAAATTITTSSMDFSEMETMEEPMEINMFDADFFEEDTYTEGLSNSFGEFNQSTFGSASSEKNITFHPV